VHEAPNDFFRYTPHSLCYMFDKAGFYNINVEPQEGFFTAAVLKANYFSCRFIRGPKQLKYMIAGFFLPFWSLGQLVAPLLDKLDRDWKAETMDYYVTAQKVVE